MSAHRNSTSVINKFTSLVIVALLWFFAIPTKVAADPNLAAKMIQNCSIGFGDLVRPRKLRRTPTKLVGKVLDIARLGKAAIILDAKSGSAAQLPELGETTYLYVIDKTSGRMALIERILDPGAEAMTQSNPKFLGSHEGLARLLQTSTSEYVQIIGAGEVVIRNGRVFSVSNGSGTFRGQTEHLNFSLEKLKSLGLKVDERTEIRDYSRKQYRDPHDVAGIAAVQARHAMKDPAAAAAMAEARRVMRAVDGRFKDTHEDFYLPARASTADEMKRMEIARASEFMYRWQLADEDDYLDVHVYIEGLGIDGFRSALRTIETFAAQNPRSP